jgi:hypothetical protein
VSSVDELNSLEQGRAAGTRPFMAWMKPPSRQTTVIVRAAVGCTVSRSTAGLIFVLLRTSLDFAVDQSIPRGDVASTRVPLLDLSSATAGIAPWILKLARGQHALAVETTVTGCGGLAVGHPSKQQLCVARRGTRPEVQLSNPSKAPDFGTW